MQFTNSNSSSKKVKRVYLTSWVSRMTKPVAILLILSLAAADVFAMHELFGQLNSSESEQWVYSLTFALCLEGIPTFMGICFSKLKDETSYKKNDYYNALLGSWVGLFGLLLAFSMVIILRLLLMNSYGGWAAFREGTYAIQTADGYGSTNQLFLTHVFLTISPVMTSFLAFITSWVVFPSDNHAQLERELDEMYLKYVDSQSEYNVAYDKLEMAKMNIWKDIASEDVDIPRSIKVFRKDCYNRIRSLLIRDCIEKLPDQVETYNSVIKQELECILKELANYASPREKCEIEGISIDSLLEEYYNNLSDEKEKQDYSNCWDSTIASIALDDKLKRLVDNAIAVAQYKSASEPRYKGGIRF